MIVIPRASDAISTNSSRRNDPADPLERAIHSLVHSIRRVLHCLSTGYLVVSTELGRNMVDGATPQLHTDINFRTSSGGA